MHLSGKCVLLREVVSLVQSALDYRGVPLCEYVHNIQYTLP